MSCTFSTYVFESIKNAFRYTARQNSKHEGVLSLNTALDPYNGSTEYIDSIDSHEDIEETVISSEEASEMKKAVLKLPPQEMELILAVYYKDLSLKAYAERDGIPYQKAVRKKNLVLGKLGNRVRN